MSKKKKLIRFARRSKVAKTTDDEQTYQKVLINKGGQHNCPYCGPWEGENKVQRKPKYGSKKPKYKNKRK